MFNGHESVRTRAYVRFKYAHLYALAYTCMRVYTYVIHAFEIFNPGIAIKLYRLLLSFSFSFLIL